MTRRVETDRSCSGVIERLVVFMAPTLLTDRPLTVRWRVSGRIQLVDPTVRRASVDRPLASFWPLRGRNRCSSWQEPVILRGNPQPVVRSGQLALGRGSSL